ncbi:MAG: response regulator transcription factor [Eubacteriales bacterium]
MAIKILLADDDRLITESLKMIIEQDDRLEVAAIANDGREAVDACTNQDIDVALMDIRMPNMNGVEATKEIVKRTDTKVLVLTTFDEDEYISKTFEYGAKGYLLKNNPPDMIINAIVSVYYGNSVVQNKVMEKLSFSNENKGEKLEGLTSREKDIVVEIANGATNKDIALKLFISEGTVKNNITNILSKLNLRHRTEIAIFYLKD